jgi:hypothetical protein
MQTTRNTDHVIQAELWTGDLQKMFEEELIATNFVEWLSWTGADSIVMHQIGQNVAQDYAEDQEIQYTNLAIGRKSFSAGGYKQSANYITNQLLQDSPMASRIKSEFVPSQLRALMKSQERDILKEAGPMGQSGQTANDYNMLNRARHRWVAGGANTTINEIDFAKAALALDQANIAQGGRVAIIDSATIWEFNKRIAAEHLTTQNQKWADLVHTGVGNGGDANGYVFQYNLFGFDCYTNPNLNKLEDPETIGGDTIQNGIENLFFSMDGSIKPFKGTVRQPPKVDSDYNKDRQREEYVTTCRFGHALDRPENMVIVLTDDTINY